MPLVTMRQILDHAAENNYGVPAFNINDMEQVIAVLQAAKKVNAPVILQTSTGARKFAGDPMIRHMVAAGIEMFPELPICIHQDHGSSVNICQSAIVNGYSSVMMDGSLEADGKTPSSYEYNVKVTKEVVARAHAVGASVEGELGVIGSLETGKGDKEDGHGAEGVIDKKRLVTDPDEAKRFVEETHVDALAVAVGTSHGAYKFTRKPDGEILASGVRKVNVDTDCRMAITGAIRKVLPKTRKSLTHANTSNRQLKKCRKSAKRVTLLSARPVMPTKSRLFRCRLWPSVMLTGKSDFSANKRKIF